MPKQFCRLLYHVVWSTKMREKLIGEHYRGALHDYMKTKIRQMDGIPYAVGGIANHVHCLVFIPPRLAVAEFIGNLKGASSHWVNHVAEPNGGFAWQSGYGLFTVSPGDQQDVTDYVLDQEMHHRKGTLREELEITGDDGESTPA
ncbi:MAG: IS200/IS605 family transposase [Patescibacteria group bacterium]